MRVEILTPNFLDGGSQHDGSPTIDVCCRCIKAFAERDPLPEEIFDNYPPETRTGSTDVAHPPYEDDVYNCHLCGRRLSSERD